MPIKLGRAHRERADKKEKMLFTLEMFAWAFICVVVVAWIGYSAYVKVAGTKAECRTEYRTGYQCAG